MTAPEYTAAQPTKRCPRCGEDKPRSAYRIDSRRRDGLQYHCIPCKSAVDREYYEKHAPAVQSRTGQYYRANREQILAERTERFQNDPEYRAKRIAGIKNWQARNPEKVREIRQRMYENGGREKARAYHVRSKFGLDAPAYQALIEAQGGVCAVCGKPEAKIVRGTQAALHVDHDHETGRVRGLLCGKCNSAIGLLGDDPALLRAALNYLESCKET